MEEKALKLLKKMTLDEKIRQVTSDMIFEVDKTYNDRRNPLCGSYRNPGHFMHQGREVPASPAQVTRQINEDIQKSIEAQPHSIPPIENGEALHGAQWGMGTNFPQPIGLASSFDPELVERVGEVIGRECDIVGVRQVFSPVVNVVRDCRWGRTVETYGEDVKLSSDLGAAMCRGLERSGVIATPKHYADNYGSGGRDSNYSETSERTMREVFLPPFKACFDAGAQSVMAAYNAWEGVPCSANRRLLTEILREEWRFDGFVVSDYSGVDGICTAHHLALSEAEACAMALKAGLDIILPYDRFDTVKEAVEKGYITEEELNENVLRILTAKFRLGLFDNPFRDPDKANALVRCDEHRSLALEAARESIVLLKNDNNILPLKKKNIRKIGVFGQSAALIPIGTNYSGPYGAPWRGEDAPTPLEALKAKSGNDIQVIYGDSVDIKTLAPKCDAVLYFTSIIEGEGSDRSDLRLPGIKSHQTRNDGGALIVDTAEQKIKENQEQSILTLAAANPNTIVVLQNGAPIDMRRWIESVPAVIEAWYPGEQGAKALVEILFGETNPCAKLPITIPKSVGQLPLYYAHKPSGRGYAYCDDDGKPMFPFGFGLSYTSFELKQPTVSKAENGWVLHISITNTGECDGAQVIQVYLHAEHTAVVLPEKELKAYRRVYVRRGETVDADIQIPADVVCYYDTGLRFGPHGGDFSLLVGTSSDSTPFTIALEKITF
ncbi:MAG: glycoside hydrolase family 3 C-terminal domain-containing protein [Clostridiales bacterium]|nr:glycoside hydrolase family 3 C-terminal domain-containing protein [Clostridiales bacterium]